MTDTFQLANGEVEYKVEYGASSKAAFKTLYAGLLPKGFTPWLTGTKNESTLVVRKRQPPRPAVSRVPILMALLTLASVVAFGVLERSVYAKFAPGIPDYVVVISYSASILAILAAHELGHRFVADREHLASPTPYLIPGIPDFTASLPSLGIVSLQREPAVNRDAVFDLSIAGPLAAFVVTVVLYFVSGFAAVQSSLPLAGNQVVNAYVSVSQVNPSVVQMAIDSALSGFTPAVAQGYFRLSPVNDAAAIGFLLTFLNLLPMTFFDGGYMAASVFGSRGVRLATYLSVLGLVTLDTPTYWVPAIIVLLIASRQPRGLVLDEVSGARPSKRLVLLLAFLLALLCLPLPQNFATFPLG